MSITVLLVDDQALVRTGLRVLLESAEAVEVVGEAANGELGVALARATHPDVVLMDIRMPTLDGLAATRLIASDPDLAATKVLILTTFETDEYVFQALRAGASGFLLKDADPTDILHGIEIVARGDALLAPSVTRRLIADLATRPMPNRGAHPALEELTAREREVMVLVAAGRNNEEIAARLTISPLTAKTHVSRAMMKLGARDRAQLVVIAYETGLVAAGAPVGEAA